LLRCGFGRSNRFGALPRVAHSLNFVAGWWLILAAFLTGAALGLGFHREDFLDGYGSFRRRLTAPRATFRPVVPEPPTP
jgi:hypothetical protein